MVPLVVQRLTAKEAAEVARLHWKTIQLAASSGRLHGHQQVKGGKWLVRADCLDAWLDGVPCQHQQSNVRKLRPTG